MMAFRTFQSRVVVSFLLLIMLVQIGTLIAVNTAIERSARADVKAELETAATVLGRLIDARRERLVHAARILSADFPFKQVVALDDRDTLLSAMDNHRARIGAELMMVVSLDGRRTVDTLQRPTAASAPTSPVAVPKLIEVARRAGEVSDFVLYDGQPYQVVMVPLLAPAPMAWIGMGFVLDRALADELQKTTSSHVSFVHADAWNVWNSITSTLPPRAERVLLDVLSRGARGPTVGNGFDLPGTDFETLVMPLPSSTGARINVALQRSLADATAPYRFLQAALLVLFAVAATISIVGGVWIARGVSRPVRQLAEAARKIEAGQYGDSVPMTRQDELGALAATFNRMTSAVAEREERLRESEERFRTMTESALDAVVTADAQGNIVSWNRGAEAIFGYAPEAVMGTPLARLVPEMQATEGSVELHGVTKDGRAFPIELSLATWETRHGSFRTAIIRDVTERKQLEEQLRQAQKMESVGRLAGGVAHDFNNLLTVIDGHAVLLGRQVGPDHPFHQRISRIQEATAHAADLTRQLLAFSRKQMLAPKVLDLNAIVVAVEPMLRRLIGEDIELVTVPARALGRVEADPGQITQIIVNLAVNARDAMPEGGKLTIETADVELDEAHAHRHADTRPGSYVMLAVSDTGVGMDEETRSHIFEPFFTTKGPGKGTGLGLATVYGIVKQSNGNIGVHSEPGRGTTFKLYLPRVDRVAEPVVVPAAASEPGGSETILLVEDNEMVRALTCEVLREHGYTVLEAHHGADALDITQRYDGPIHLLLTDVVMPGMGGWELASRLAPGRPGMRVLYMSGYAADAIVHQGILGDGEAFLPKPIKADTLSWKVREVLDGGREPRGG
jgi:PAS domain S-box-containing protein